MIQVVIENLTPNITHRFIFICQKSHVKAHDLRAKLSAWANNCEIVGFDPNGLGQGRIYNDEEQKCDNIGQTTDGQNGCMKPEDTMRYYGPRNEKNNAQRQTVQGGGEMLNGGDNKVYQ